MLTNNFLKQDHKLEKFEHTMQEIHDSIQNIQVGKEKALKIFTLLRDHLSPQITLLQNQLEECLAAKSSYDKFVAIDLNAIELVAYAPCALISVSDALKDNWKKQFEQLKTSFSDCFPCFDIELPNFDSLFDTFIIDVKGGDIMENCKL